jgi:hypothetical protein
MVFFGLKFEFDSKLAKMGCFGGPKFEFDSRLAKVLLKCLESCALILKINH